LRGKAGAPKGDEENRVADFTNWLALNEEKGNAMLDLLERFISSFQHRYFGDNAEIGRLVAMVRAPEINVNALITDPFIEGFDDGSGAERNASNAMTRAEDALRKGEMVTAVVRKWRVFGFADTARGGIIWHRLWSQLQSSLVWGYYPLYGACAAEQQPKKAIKVWRLSVLEGPDRGRRLLEQVGNTRRASGAP